MTLEEVTVCFSVEEWALLQEWQRELHREVTAATAQLLASLGRAPQGLLRLRLHIPIHRHGDKRWHGARSSTHTSR